MRRGLVLALAFTSLVACGGRIADEGGDQGGDWDDGGDTGDASHVVPPDASADARRDAPSDARRDAGIDASREASVDASFDVGVGQDAAVIDAGVVDVITPPDASVSHGVVVFSHIGAAQFFQVPQGVVALHVK